LSGKPELLVECTPVYRDGVRFCDEWIGIKGEGPAKLRLKDYLKNLSARSG